jgi:hypothetical protein
MEKKVRWDILFQRLHYNLHERHIILPISIDLDSSPRNTLHYVWVRSCDHLPAHKHQPTGRKPGDTGKRTENSAGARMAKT